MPRLQPDYEHSLGADLGHHSVLHDDGIYGVGIANRPRICKHCVNNIGVGCSELRNGPSEAFDSDCVQRSAAAINRGVQNLLTRVFLENLLDELLQGVVGVEIGVGVKAG